MITLILPLFVTSTCILLLPKLMPMMLKIINATPSYNSNSERIVLSELSEIGNFCFHRVYLELFFCLFGGGAVALDEIRGESIE